MSKNLLEIFKVQEAYRLPDAIMRTLQSEHAADIIRNIKDSGITDMRDMFQMEQGDRKKLKQDFTPDCVCEIVSKLMKEGTCIDMCSGTGALNKRAAEEHKIEINEYEYSEKTVPFALLDACVNGLEGHISRTDCLKDIVYESFEIKKAGDISIPQRVEIQEMKQYDNVIMNPPYSMPFPDTELYKIRGCSIPKSKADYGFLLRGLEHMYEGGRLIAILPHGVLFRGNGEGKIREQLIKEHLISCVIGLPDKLFLNTDIPVCILILEKNADDILFVDASKEYIKKSAQNDMNPEQIKKAVETFEKHGYVEKYASVISYREIEKNEYNLNIPRYVDTFEEEPMPNLESLLINLETIAKEEEKVRYELYHMLGEMTGNKEDMKYLEKHRELIKPKNDGKGVLAN